MKKLIVISMLAAGFLTACAKTEPAVTATEVTQAAATPTELPAATATPTVYTEPTKPDMNEDPDDVEIKNFKEEIVHNGFFSACLVKYDLSENDEDMTTVVFEFTNITDKTYYKNDEEIVPGGTWEKTISYPGDKWNNMAGDSCWIHYDLYEDAENTKQIFKGGLKFQITDDLMITDIDFFEE